MCLNIATGQTKFSVPQADNNKVSMSITLKLEYPHKICGLIGNAVDEQRVKYKVQKTEQNKLDVL